jgi:hypothetical protein
MDYEGRKVIYHGGGLPGVHTKAAFVPSEKLGIVILSNQIGGLVDPLMLQILDIYLKDDSQDRLTDGMKRYKDYEKRVSDEQQKREAKRVTNSSASYPLEAYKGMYEDKLYGEAEITYDNNDLHLTLLPTKELFNGRMEQWHFNTFRIVFNDPFLPPGFVTFELNADGEITGFKIDLPNPDFHFYNLDFKKKK